MTERYSSQFLFSLRNEIPIDDVIQLYLDITTNERNGRIKFVCPICKHNNTATNDKTNLARCFDCRKNFNTIDIVMAERKYSFTQAVQFLDSSNKKKKQNADILQNLIATILRK